VERCYGLGSDDVGALMMLLVCAGWLLYRVIKMGKDDRFDDTRDNFFKFLAFWIAQV